MNGCHQCNQIKQSNNSSIRGLHFMPSCSIPVMNFFLVSDLVRQSAVILSVLQCSSLTTLSSANSHIWWYCTLICLVLVWNSGFFTSASELMLLSSNYIAFDCWLSMIWTGPLIISCSQSSWRKLLTQTATFPALDRLIYSASVMDVTVVFCFQLYHINDSSSDRKTVSFVNHQSHQLSVYTESE